MTETHDIPDPTWVHADVTYDVAESGPEAWEVTAAGAHVGTIVLLPNDETPVWSVRLDGNSNFGIGVSWPTWQEALTELVESRLRSAEGPATLAG